MAERKKISFKSGYSLTISDTLNYVGHDSHGSKVLFFKQNHRLRAALDLANLLADKAIDALLFLCMKEQVVDNDTREIIQERITQKCINEAIEWIFGDIDTPHRKPLTADNGEKFFIIYPPHKLNKK